MSSTETAYSRAEIRNIFEHAVSVASLERLGSPDRPLSKTAHQLTATVLFADIGKAGDLLRNMSAEQTRQTITEVLKVITDVSIDHGGYVQQYIGDAAVVIFGAPLEMSTADQARAAAETGMEVQQKVRSRELEIGIAFHTATMAFGNFAPDSRPTYAPFGRDVYKASILQEYSRMAGYRPIVAAGVRELIQSDFRTAYVSSGTAMRGEMTFHAYAILGSHNDLSEEDASFWDQYDRALSLVGTGNSAAALRPLRDLLEQRPDDQILTTAIDHARRSYAGEVALTLSKTRDVSELAMSLNEAVELLFGPVEFGVLEPSPDTVWRFRGDAPLAARNVVFAPTGEAMIWMRGLTEAARTADGPQAVGSVGFSALAPMRKDNELAAALFVNCHDNADLSVLTVLADALSEPWVSKSTAELRELYREQVDLADKLESVNQELEAKSNRLEQALAENQELNRTLEQRVADHATRLERATTLKRYLPPAVVEEIINGGRDLAPRTERRKITVMFSDIHGFTAATDGLEPEELSRLLNGYLSAMSSIAYAYGATIDKFRGDGMMVFFGAPTPLEPSEGAHKCVSMAIDMCKAVETLREQWFDSGYDWDLGIRVGINTGYATVGEFGSPQRMDYTAVGTEVNLAARLETACETDSILIGHSTWALVKDDFRFTSLGQIEVKGIHRKVRAYQVRWR